MDNRKQLIIQFADLCFDEHRKHSNRDWTEDDATEARQAARLLSTDELRAEIKARTTGA